MHTRHGRDTHDMIACTHDIIHEYTRHGQTPHDMVVTHDMIRPCRGVHITMSCRTCTHDMVPFHTTWSRSTRHDHVVWNISHVPHDMVNLYPRRDPRHGQTPHDMVRHHTTWSTRHGGCRVEIRPCRVCTMSCGTSDHVVWCFGFTDVTLI